METEESGRKFFTGHVLSQMCLAPGFYLMSLRVPRSLEVSAPGQFIMIRPRQGMFLPRPISIHSIGSKSGRVVCELLYQTVGKGTTLLSELKKGTEVLVHGPLGRGFNLELPERVVLVAGGMGIAPLKFAAQTISRSSPKREIIFYRGARCASLLPEIAGLREVCSKLYIGTDDGSIGRRGFVTEFFKADLPLYEKNNTAVLACGPRDMLRGLKRILAPRQIPCQVSVEERMACGVGACLGCVVRSASGGYLCACKDGPVFNLGELALDDAE